MTELELSFGGDGNGLYVPQQDKVVKGVTEMATELGVLGAKEDLCMFHTRKASCGGIKDDLCHPFVVEGDSGKYAVMHNGHWSPWWGYSDGEKSDTQTMANLVAKHGIGVLAGDVAKDSGVWVVFDRDIKRMYVIRRGGTFYLQRLRKMDEADAPAFFHASEPLQVFSNIRTCAALIHQDKFYELRPSGRAKEKRTGFPAVEPEKKRGTYTSPSKSSSQYWDGDSWYSGYNNDQWIHEYAYGYDGKNFACCCKVDKTCKQCDDHKETFGALPVYEEDRDWVEGCFTSWDKAVYGLPVDFVMPEAPVWVQKNVERRRKKEEEDKKRSEERLEDIEKKLAKSDAAKKEVHSEVDSLDDYLLEQGWVQRADGVWFRTEYVEDVEDVEEEVEAELAAVAAEAGDADFLSPQKETKLLPQVSSASPTYPFDGQYRCLTAECKNYTDYSYCDECVWADPDRADEDQRIERGLNGDNGDERVVLVMRPCIECGGNTLEPEDGDGICMTCKAILMDLAISDVTVYDDKATAARKQRHQDELMREAVAKAFGLHNIV